MSKLKSSSNKYKPFEHFGKMTFENLVWGTTGLILGLIINDTVILLSNYLNIKYLLIQNIMQISLCSILLSLIHTLLRFKSKQ